MYRSEKEMKKIESDRQKFREQCIETFGTDSMVADVNPRVIKDDETLTKNYYGIKSSRF